MLEGGNAREVLTASGKLLIDIHSPWLASHNEHTCSEKLIPTVLRYSVIIFFFSIGKY